MNWKIVGAGMLSAVIVGTAGAAQDVYVKGPEISIGGEGGWDILTIDSAARRLYLSHSTKVEVIDLEKNKVAGAIADTPGVHAFVAVPEVGHGFSTNGKEAKASVVDLKTLQTVSKVDTGEGPDAAVYDSSHGEVYIFNHRGNSATVIDAKTAKVVTTIPLSGSPEFAVVDAAAGRIYCNIEDKSEVVAIDPAKHEVVSRWPLAPGAGPSGIALDAAHHRLFSTCDNKLMTMLDTGSGKVVATVPIGQGPDGCAFDDKMQLAFASCGEGVTTIAKEETPGKLTVVQSLATQRGARTMALDPATDKIYLPVAQYESAPTPAPGAPRQRPKIAPNTFKLMIFLPHSAAGNSAPVSQH